MIFADYRRCLAVLSGLALATAVLTACGGGSGGAALTPTNATSAGKSGATFMIHVPHASSQGTQTQSASRKPAYISPATQSITVVITPQSGGPAVVNETVGLTPTSQGCTSTLASTLCELQVALSAGSYDATLTTFDGANGTGNTLSTAQNIPFTIVAGQNNQVNLTLSGIPAQIVTKYQATDKIFVVVALDADNNVIVGSGAPSFAVSQTGGTLAVTLTQPKASAPNVFTAVPTSTNASATLSITASYPTGTNGCVQAGAICTATLTLKAADQLFVASFGTSGSVAEYTFPYIGSPIATIQFGQNGPGNLAADANGNLLVPVSQGLGGNAIVEYAPPYTGSPTATISNSVSNPLGVAIDADGNLFVANGVSSTVTEYAPPYTGSPEATISSGIAGPDGAAIDASGDLFVANRVGGTVTEYARPYTDPPMATITNGVNGPGDVALDASGNLFVANGVGSTVTEYAPPYTGAPTTTVSNGLDGPQGMAFDASGNLFVANNNNNTITEYAPPYSGVPVATLTNVIGPMGLAFFNTLSVSP